jgi:uncharacterized protein
MRTATATALWLLMGLFALRVLGQVLVEFWHVRCLPPSEEWFSGLLNYPALLTSQIVILLLMLKIGVDFSRQKDWSYRSRRSAGFWLLAFGVIYLSVMIIRYVVRMSLYPHERWTGGSIPIFFHWVLAAYVLVLGLDHWQRRIRLDQVVRRGRFRRWAAAAGWWGSGILVIAAVASWVVYLLLPSLLAHQLAIRRAEYAVRIERSLRFTTSDGVELAADVYHPRRAPAKTPTILVRIPYSKTATNKFFATVVGQMWAERGYTVVIQGTRGRYESGGQYDPLRHERQDGVETLQWIAGQPWYDGRLGMWGGSYFGYTQWAIADCKDPGPTALLIQEASSDFHGMFYPGGAFSLQTALRWAVMSRGEQDVTPEANDLSRGFTGFPLVEADDRAVGDVRFFNDWVLHQSRDDYWAQIDGDSRASRLQAPVLLMAGWYDPFLPTQLNDFMRIQSDADPRIAAQSCLIIGPWMHAETVSFRDGAAPRNYRLESLAPSVAWFDRHLQGADGPAMPPIRIYVLGIHQWRDEQEWPLARTEYTSHYLHSKGAANSAQGDGRLTLDPAKNTEPPDQFSYDPRNPVPTAGGAMLGSDAGIARQNEVEAREDVLVYTSEPVAEDLEITGPIELVLYVSTTAPCTDFTAKLVDVHPDGETYNLSEGIRRRNYDQPSADPTEISIHLWPTSTVFRTGHRLRLEVSSSNYPRFDRNPNTGRDIAFETAPVTAAQSVFHTATSPSRLILPLIPRR